jgi:hypothetical protein
MEKRDVWLISSAAVPLRQSPIIQTCYLLVSLKPGEFTYVTLRQVSEEEVHVDLRDEPEPIVVPDE